MAPARILPLPHDIVHILIDPRGDSKVDLASCSLVCRDWLQPWRSNLFRPFDVYSTHADDDFSAFTELLASPGAGDPPSQVRERRCGSGVIGKLVFYYDADQFEHFVDTLKVLHLSTDISELEFWAGLVWWSDPADVLKGLRWSGSANVQSLAFVDFLNGWTSNILQAITQSGSLDGALDTLAIGPQGYADEVEPILPFLQAVAPRIRRLRLNPIPPNMHISSGFGAFTTCRIPLKFATDALHALGRGTAWAVYTSS
ncbi:hypothetical protein NUW54_g6109 [Trametes sanguinea]|uniref:Uncharacterized protein n=1 Tax=Trametes sanguinea TaxID=158606 RepID=A0ACC1PTP4_9APHY|nr:hypothetical protein NUW54_g6109 [Trametes sanguinea]